MGEQFQGGFSLEMDAVRGSVLLSLRGEKSWYKVREVGDGVEILDNEGIPLGRVPGVHLPHVENMQDTEIESAIPACVDASSDELLPVSEPPPEPVTRRRRRFTTRILPEMSQREVLTTIRGEFKQTHQINGALHEKDSTLWYSIDIPSDKMPNLRIIMTTQATGKRDGEDSFAERVLILRLFTGILVHPDQARPFLEKLNHYHNRCWAGCFRIHDDHEIEGSWALNILEGGILVDYVWDAMVRILTGWRSLYQDLKPLL
jgi:hypothetical protein